MNHLPTNQPQTFFKLITSISFLTVVGIFLLLVFKPEIQKNEVLLSLSYILIGVSLAGLIIGASYLSIPASELETVGEKEVITKSDEDIIEEKEPRHEYPVPRVETTLNPMRGFSQLVPPRRNPKSI